jgi:hypothetical protein
MDQKRPLRTERLAYRAVLVMWIVVSGLMLFLLNGIDIIVNGELYNFGLQLSADWLLPYWTYIRLIYALLGLSIIISIITLSIGFVGNRKQVAENLTSKPLKPQLGISRQSKTKKENRTSPEGGSGRLISCSACGRKIARTMTLLSYIGGKPRLVNVCPYCNHPLDNHECKQSQKIKL